jgi:polysaccharide export outer membrane protein
MPTSCFRATLAGLAVAFVCAACQGPATKLKTNVPEPTLSAQLDWGAFPLGPNDVVRVGVYGHDALATPGTRIDMEGNLSLPLVGAVHVAGLSSSEAREAVTQAYSAYVIEPRVDLSVVTHGARRFYALGEFARPGAIEFDRPLTVLQAVALAGGVTGRGAGKHAILLRGDPKSLEVEVINLSTLDRKGFLALRPDDVLFVRRNNAGKFSDELLPYLAGISSSLASVATVLLIEDRLSENN